MAKRLYAYNGPVNRFSMPDYTEEANQQALLDGLVALRPSFIQSFQFLEERPDLVFQRNVERDWLPLTSVLDVATQEEFHDEVLQMCEALYGKDSAAKKPWLDKVCNLRDSFDVTTADLSKPEDLKKALSSSFMIRVMPRLEAENKDYFEARYPDRAQKLKLEALKQTHAAFGTLVETMAVNAEEANLEGPRYMRLSVKPYTKVGELAPLQQNLRLCAMKYGTQVNMKNYDELPYTVPKEFARFLNKDIKKLSTPQAQDDLEDKDDHEFLKPLYGAIPAMPKGLAESSKITQEDLIYIDGKTVRSIIDAKKLSLDPEQREKLRDNILATALTSGTNRVDVAQMFRNGTGNFAARPYPVKVDLTEMGDTTKQDYSWVRRHLFNYGPLKCRTRAEKADALYAKEYSKKENKRMDAAMLGLTSKLWVYDDGLNVEAAEEKRVREEAAHKQLLLDEAMEERQKAKEQAAKEQAAKALKTEEPTAAKKEPSLQTSEKQSTSAKKLQSEMEQTKKSVSTTHHRDQEELTSTAPGYRPKEKERTL